MGSFASAVFGLIGVVIGGVISWWQTVAAQKAKRMELETNFQHERVLRDEASKRTALLEVYYLLRVFEHETYVLYSEHHHGTGDSPMTDICGSVDISLPGKCFRQYRESVDRHAAILGKALTGELERIIDDWDAAILDGSALPGRREYDRDYGYKYPVYCDTGYDFMVIHQDVEQAIKAVTEEIKKTSAI